MNEELAIAVARLQETIRSIDGKITSLSQDINATSESTEAGRSEIRVLQADLRELRREFTRLASEDMESLKKAVDRNGDFAAKWDRTTKTWIAMAGAVMGVLGLLQMPWAQPILAALGVGQ